MTQTTRTGFLDDKPWPKKLVARALLRETSGAVRVFGYAAPEVVSLLGMDGLWYLALRGELPTKQELALFSCALGIAANVSAADGAVHAAMIARLCGAGSARLLSTAAIGASECAQLMATTDRLEDAGDDFVARRTDAVAAFPTVPGLAECKHRMALVARLLDAAGVGAKEQVTIAVSVAILPLVMAEALAGKPNAFDEYPMNLPPIDYVEGP